MNRRRMLSFACILPLLASISMFFAGFHNVDLAINRFYLAYYNNRYLGLQDTVEGFCDETIFNGRCYDYGEVYLNGVRMLILSFFVTTIIATVLVVKLV